MKSIKAIAHHLGISKLAIVMAVILSALTGCKKEDNFVPVSSISGVPAVAEATVPLTLTATVSPSDATNQSIVWTVKSAGSTGASISGGNILTATAAGTKTVTATIANGATKNTPFTKDFSITVNDAFVPVSNISNVPTEANVDSLLTLTATITPSNATNQTIVWSVKDAGATGASLTEGNKLKIASAGAAIVTATIAEACILSRRFRVCEV